MPTLIMELHEPAFWLAILNVIWIDALLSGDNALVIAMACNNLPPKQRFWGITLGALTAIVMRIAFTGIVSTLITLPYLKIAGGLCLMLVAIKMCLPQDDDGGGKSANHLLSAIVLVVVADFTMSLDNMIAVAAVAKGYWLILAIGLVISIPMVIGGATVISMILNKLPVLIWAGAALLGWLGGELIATDPVLASLQPDQIVWGAVCVVIVISTGFGWPYLWGTHEHSV